MATNFEQVGEKLLGEASNELATKQQRLTERQQSGKNVKAATAEVSQALERVEALQEGVNFVLPTSEPERSIAVAAATIITIMLDGEGAASKWRPEVLEMMTKLYEQIPDEEATRFHVARQGQPYVETGRTDKTPTTRFDTGRTIVATTHAAAIRTLIETGDECGDPYGETPPIEDGEVLVVLGMKNRIVDPENIWVERVERPVFKGVAPHDNSGDKRFN